MNKTGLIIATIGFTSIAGAQRLDLRSLSEIRQFSLRTSEKLNPAAKNKMSALVSEGSVRKKGKRTLKNIENTPVEPQAQTLAFVTLADGFSADDLAKEGVEVMTVAGRIALVKAPVLEASRISQHPAVKAMSLQKKIFASMDLARAEAGVDYIHKGNKEQGLSVPYTGAGVITAIADQGIDAHHINFRLPNNESRIGYLGHLRFNASGTDIAETHYNELNINEFVTDVPSAYHGTHTLGIFAGGYDGPVKVGKPWDNPSIPQPAEYITENCKYYGVAPGSNIAVTCGDLADGFIALGMDYMYGFAEYLDRPIVYNLSLGSSMGPHDPRSAMSQFLDEIGKLGIICISAGNEGDLKIALKKTFSEEETSFKTLIYPYAYAPSEDNPDQETIRYGAVAVYSNDETPFKLQAVIYNKSRGYRAAMRMPVIGENIGTYYCSSTDYQMDSSDIIGDATFKKAFEGYVGVGGKIDEQTGRYYGMVDFYTINNIISNLDDNYVLGFEVEGVPGQTIECYGDGLTTWLDNYGVEGFTDGSMDGTISDLAVGHNLLVVGSYNTRQEWTCLDGGISGYPGEGFAPGEVSGFSSFGTLSDGRQLPHVCAPGSAIISSVSWPFAQLAAQEYGEGYLDFMCQAKLEEDGRINYWKQEVGTSMATPFVAGSIALWLEANPDLTIDDVKQIVAKTAVRDDQVEKTKDQVRWGAGKFDALAGLKEAIRMSAGVGGVEADLRNDRLILSKTDDRIFRLFVGGAETIDTKIYSTDGRLVYSSMSEGDEATADLSGLLPGIYIVSINGRHSERIILK
ncbi:MAG: S8 family peptidase [Muribaculaceae bacterium]|nr:S8 family peptidase [Muribaculaceae bacterium]